jgi:hypothetical protein
MSAETEKPDGEPNESAWSEEAVEGQLDELEDDRDDETSGGEEEADEG